MAKVSIIIPCYNYAHFLKECVDSVRSQTYKNIEIIVVNDGSPDDTEEVCKELGVTCVTKQNGGLGSARNFGIKHAKGKYIMCLDADDKLPARSIENHMEIIDQQTIAQCGLQEFGDRQNAHNPQGANLQSLLDRNTVYCNAMFPKAMWKKVGGYDESDTIRLGYEDWEFWIRAVAAGYEVKTLNRVGLFYRIHKSSMIHTTTLKNHDILKKYIMEKNGHLLKTVL